MFTLTIQTGNAAFAEDPAEEIARILRELAQRISMNGKHSLSLTLRDDNGNTIGRTAYQPD